MQIFTCGHGSRPFEELVQLLTAHGITLLVDVRARPQSRFHPQFNRRHLQENLPMKYLWLGDKLGGKNEDLIPPEVFEEGIDELLALARNETVSIMCSERSPTPTKWRPEGCHRWRTITPVLEKRGVEVVHLS
jgi:uncharacterized protein (DUF488 family)